jgi:branched-chain amino acid transport system permease protein
VKALFDVRTSAARDIITYWTALALAVATILLVYLILRSRHGLALAAIRDSEVRQRASASTTPGPSFGSTW